MKNGWLFPGQASQKVGMGKDLFEKTEIGKKYYTIANDILDIDIQSISFNGPEELLNITKYTQPAIFIVSTIIGQIMIENGYSTNGVAGHSLGEYSALAVSGAYNFESGLELVKLRSESMYNAGKTNPGTMAAIVGMSAREVENLCTKNNTSDNLVVAANYNTENQIVVSGHIESVEALIRTAKNNGAKMAVPLNVSGAFHSPLMTPAREELAAKLDSIDISDISIPLYTNVDAKPITKGRDIKDSLIRQLENPVLWYNSIENMIRDGFNSFLEVGPGKILQGLNRKINNTIPTQSIQSHEDILNYEV
ncbi:MAG: ACP S-malonyltransferase [Candidatus Neomarinimicrobiota bacterium]|nr:ACP S-malonyltransferase [Candidatus Neomarinimicrobiota bacterium]